jgi:hypothetical protein
MWFAPSAAFEPRAPECLLRLGVADGGHAGARGRAPEPEIAQATRPARVAEGWAV